MSSSPIACVASGNAHAKASAAARLTNRRIRPPPARSNEGLERVVTGLRRSGKRRNPDSNRSVRLDQPGLEEPLDVAAAARLLEPCQDPLALDDVERRHALEVEALGQIGSLLAVDAVDLERFVIPALLQDLGEEPVHAPAPPGLRRVEEDEPRLFQLYRRGDGHQAETPLRST